MRSVTDWTDADAERAVLAAVLLDPEHAWPRVSRIVDEASFADPHHQVIWTAMARLAARREPVDIHTLAAELRAMQRLNTVGGAQYLGELTDTIPTIAHCESHARIVVQHATVRRLRDEMRLALARIDHGGDPGPVIDDVQKALHRARVGGGRREMLRSILDVSIDAWGAYIEASEGRSLAVPTGLVTLDGSRALASPGFFGGGLWPGELVVLAADQGGGKTAFALRLARHVAGLGLPVLFFSGEMGARELFWRLVCAEAGVESTKVRAALTSQDEINAMQRANEVIAPLPIRVCDARVTARDIRHAVIDARAEGSVALVIVDYLQIMLPPEGMPDEKGSEIIDANALAMKHLAREVPLPVVLLSQFNRAGQNSARKPRIQDLKGSGGIESHADNVMVLFPADGRADGPAPPVVLTDLLVLKARSGATGEVPLRFVRKYTRFEEIGVAREGAMPDSAHRDAPDDLDMPLDEPVEALPDYASFAPRGEL